MYQSAYKPLHSTETALVKVFNDILVVLDRRNIMCIVLLDLSAAFNTVDCEILLERIQASQCVYNDALTWISSYLSERSQRLEVQGVSSKSKELACGMPQGSKFGPRFYSKYTEPLGQLLKDSVNLLHFATADGS